MSILLESVLVISATIAVGLAALWAMERLFLMRGDEEEDEWR